MTPFCYHKYQFWQYQVLKNANFLQKFRYFSEKFYFYRIKYMVRMKCRGHVVLFGIKKSWPLSQTASPSTSLTTLVEREHLTVGIGDFVVQMSIAGSYFSTVGIQKSLGNPLVSNFSRQI